MHAYIHISKNKQTNKRQRNNIGKKLFSALPVEYGLAEICTITSHLRLAPSGVCTHLEFFNLGQIILAESTACLPLFQFHLKTSVIVK